ncbi:MAG: glycosyltransferase family 2 protein [Bradyrhizobium sp.]|nr:glycosyltransferase family 2 protein [Bradyrhizobium sp.]
MAKVDIVIPCYNYGRFLRLCVGTVLSQSVSDIRVLIIDDASSDDSRTVAASLAAADARVSFISHTKNAGHIRTYNEGIDWIDSDYFLLLSADDLLVPGSLERASRIMDENPDVVMTHGKGVEWNDDAPFPTEIGTGDGSWNREDLIGDICADGANRVVTPAVIVRTSVQKSIGGYDVDLPHSADLAMWLRFGAEGSIARIHAVQAIYRRHVSNMSVFYYAEKLRDYEQRKAAFDKFFRTSPKLPAKAVDLERQANRKLAAQAYWTGLRQLFLGRASKGLALLCFATKIDPHLYYSPPLRQLLHAPLGKILASIAQEAHLYSSDRE